MAVGVQAASSSNSSNSDSTPPWKFHVFLSFRGEDTRRGFTDHLYAALKRKGFKTFRDDEELGRGEIISQKLLKAIEESLSAIVVLSQDYASSSWCLDELQKILDSRNELGQEVFPIFYGVDPSDVRHQKGGFAEAFTKHEENFKKDQEKVQKWRDSLTKVANLSGWDSKSWHETELIENVVDALWTKLRSRLPSYKDTLVGIDWRIDEMDSHLEIGLDDVRFIGIWGMGGIGKTTLARIVYERFNSQFEICCFLANVREVSEKDCEVHLQKILLSRLKVRNMEIEDVYEGKKTIKNLYCNIKVLLVLDDVNSISQLQNLAGMEDWFGAGSRVIITTRDIHLLISHGVHKIYEAEILSKSESLQLLSEKAFRRDQPKEGFLELSESVVQYAGGLPLALQILGSFLCGRSVPQWKDALNKLRKVPKDDILKILKISYDGLEDSEKAIFLDIACFFKGWSKYTVTQILKNCGLHPTVGISILIEKSLLIDGVNLEMHDLLQELGRSIVFKESGDNAGKRSRLWSVEDIDQVLTKNMGTEVIQGMVLHLDKPYEARWDPEAFSKMCNLRLLIISSNFHLPYGLKCFSSALKVLEWWGCPLKALPPRTQLNELVDLKMHHSKIKQLWNKTQSLEKLKFMDLSYSEHLTKTPNFLGVPNLKRLILEGCTELFEVHPSLGQLKKLVEVNLKGCKSLKTLPSKLEMYSLKVLVLAGCSKVKKLPEFGEDMENLIDINLEDTAILKLPASLGLLTGLEALNLRGCKNLVCLPHTILNLKRLKILNICGCSKFSKLPENLNENEALEKLDVSGTAIREVPSSIIHLGKLKTLSFHGCKGLASNSMSLMLHPSIFYLKSMTQLDLSYCNIGEGFIPDDLSCLSSLCELNLAGNSFMNLPIGCISNLSQLQYLDLNFCIRLQSLPKLPPSLLRLEAGDCASMEPLTNQMLWDLVVSLDQQHHRGSKDLHYAPLEVESENLPQDFIATMPGSKIPSWFHNQNCSIMPPDGKLKSSVSIIVEIPQSCRASEWSAIAICFVLDDLCNHTVAEPDLFPQYSHKATMFWTSNSLEDDGNEYRGWGHAISAEGDYPHLCFLFLHCNDKTCWQHLRGDSNQLQLKFYTSSDLFGRSPAKIKKCGWRMLCKEDIEEGSLCDATGDMHTIYSAII